MEKQLISIRSVEKFVDSQFGVSIGLRKRISEVLHNGVVDGSEIFEMFCESSCD